MEKSKLSRQAKVKRIQHHWMSFTINAKGTSPGRKHKRRKRPTENKPKTIKKMIIESYILTNTLNVKGTKRQTDWVAENMCRYALPPTTSLCLTPQIVCNYFILLRQSCSHYGLQL